MKYIGSDFKNLDSIDKSFWIYNIDKRDFFLIETDNWYEFKTDSYLVSIGMSIMHIPINYYIIIGDYDGGLDTITPAEIVGREFEAFVFNNDFENDSWVLEPIKIIGYEENSNFIIPETKFPYPVLISDKKAVLISEKEVYNKLKHLMFIDIV